MTKFLYHEAGLSMFSVRDRSSDSGDDGFKFLILVVELAVGLFSECNHPGFGFLFGQLACLHSVLFMCQVEIGLS